MGDDFEEVHIFNAAKRCGIQHCPWMGDWLTSWSPRNNNTNAEGSWHHWANLAAHILSHPATKEVAPDLYRPDLKTEHLYNGGNQLDEAQLEALFPAITQRKAEKP